MKLAKFFAGCLMVLAGSAVAAAQPVPATSESAHSDLRVRLLGTGSPLPQTFRFGPSTLIEAGNQKFLFDAGRGVIQRLYSFGIPFNDVDKLFLTHLHSDHTIGIPDLYLTGWLRGRNHPLHVWGPVGTRNLMDELVKAYSFDIKIRLDHNPGSKVETTEFTAGVIYDHDGVKITAFPSITAKPSRLSASGSTTRAIVWCCRATPATRKKSSSRPRAPICWCMKWPRHPTSS